MILPTSRETEMAVLGSMVVREESIAQVDLDPECFYFPRNRRAFKAIRRLAERNGGAIDLIGLKREMEGNEEDPDPGAAAQYLSKLVDGGIAVPKGRSLEVYCLKLQELAYRRQVMTMERDAARMISEGDMSPDQVEDARQRALASIRERFYPQERDWSGGRGLAELREFWQFYDDRNMETSFGPLDDVIGDLYPGMVLTVMARPGVGKSYLGSNLVARWIEKTTRGIVWASLEMPRALTIERLVRQRLGISKWGLREQILSGNLPDWVRPELDRRLALVSRPKTTVARLAQIAGQHRMNTGEPIGAVVVDYLQYMDRNRLTERPYERVTRLCQELKELAKDLDCLVVVLSQVKRPGESKAAGSQFRRPTMEDARDSGAVEENADVLVGIWREEGDDQVLNFEAVKVREGGQPFQPSRLFMDWNTGRLQDAYGGPWQEDEHRAAETA